MYLKTTLLAAIVTICLSFADQSHSLNRYFEVNPGFRLSGMVIDINSRVPDNHTTTTFDFGGGLSFDFVLERIVSFDLDILYLRKGSAVTLRDPIVLHYLSVPTLFKFWMMRNKMAFVIGPVHNFLLATEGRLVRPNERLSKANTNFYDIGMAVGVSYVMYDFGNGMKMVGDLRFEFGLNNVFKDFRPELFNRTSPYLGIGLTF
ncbi:MAG: PorT family protein [Spirochaetota bacterium]|nr:PorT family protein [Spirochaetota bacterium]